MHIQIAYFVPNANYYPTIFGEATFYGCVSLCISLKDPKSNVSKNTPEGHFEKEGPKLDAALKAWTRKRFGQEKTQKLSTLAWFPKLLTTGKYEKGCAFSQQHQSAKFHVKLAKNKTSV